MNVLAVLSIWSFRTAAYAADPPAADPPAPSEPAPGEPAPSEPAPPAPAPTPPFVSAPLAPSTNDAGVDPELPIPTMEIDRIPPRSSYELAVQFGYGDVAYWREQVPPWTSFGIRTAWGRNLGQSRVGLEGVAAVEGPFGVHVTVALEPRLAFDVITGLQSGAQLGLSLGPAFMFHAASNVGPDETAFTVAPVAAARIGWSQGWSRVGRRFFIGLEPRVRYSTSGDSEKQPFSPGVNLIIGSGRGA